jgi:hypothetical protein
MTERLKTEVWTYEVCEYWLSQAYDTLKELGLSGSELNDYFQKHAPDAVLNYMLRKSFPGNKIAVIPDQNGSLQ